MQPSTWNDERITAYVLGELSPSESSQLEAEMQSIPEISKAIDEAKRITQQLSAVFAAEPLLALDAIKRREILQTPVTSSAPVVSLPADASHGSARRFLALAATVLLVGGVGTFVYLQAAANRRSAMTEVAMSKAVTAPLTESLEMRRDGAVASTDRFSDAADYSEFKKQESEQIVEPLNRPTEPLVTQLDAAPREESNEYRFKQNAGKSAPAMPAPKNAIVDGEMMGPAGPLMPLPSVDMKADRAKQISNFNGRTSQLATEADTPNFDLPELGAKPIAPMPGMVAEPQGVMKDTTIEVVSELGVIILRGSQQQVSDSVKELNGKVATSSSEMRTGPAPALPLSLTPNIQPSFGAFGAGDRFEPIVENDFRRASEQPLSTFSIDVDTASYSKVRQFIMQAGALPPAGAVRIEELVNYFQYDYEPPAADSEHPFASRVEVAACPWKPEHRLARIAIKGKVIANESRPASNLVFLVDTSGSMNEPNKLPLVKQGLEKLVSRLGERDRVAIVVYAGSAGLVLDSTLATERSTILRRINQMQSGGSTNGGEGIRLAYQVARDHFIKGAVNRVILCSDGDFNVGTTSDDELVTLVESESKGGIDITVLGFGMGNHNDSMMEKISGRGNGNYAFIDSASEADRVLVEQTSGTLVTIARDVKIQVEFNPTEVAAYRLIGYENRKLANEDFKDDTKDAGEIGAGHSVTALYELIPATGDVAALAPTVDELRYQKEITPTDASKSGELMTVKLRYKKPDSNTSIPVSFPATDGKRGFAEATADFRFAVAVAGFGMLLRSSEHIGNWTLSEVVQVAEGSKGTDPHGLRAEFIEIVRRATQLRGSER